MAAKKKVVAKKAPAKAKKAPAAPVHKDSVAVKVLGSLPALTGKLRLGFKRAFTDAQCLAWGEQTKATNVVAEASKWLQVLEKSLKEDSRVAYSRRRLTYLAELVVLLEDELGRTSQSPELRSSRNAALAVAVNARRELARLVRAVAGGQDNILSELAKNTPDDERVPSQVQESLTATIALATRLRRDEVLEAVADDVGLTEARLNSAYAALEALTGATEVALNSLAYEGDAPSVNLIEGRVLREMRLAQRQVDDAREKGVSIPSLVAGPSLKALLSKEAAAKPAKGAPAAPAA